MPDEALQWATQQGFMSLEVDEVPLSTFAGMPLDNDGEADEAEARPKKKSKKDKKAQKALSSEADARAMATEPDEAEADGGDKAAKRKRKEKVADVATPAVEEDAATAPPSVDGDLFASLVNEIAMNKSRPAPARPAASAAAAPSAASSKRTKRAKSGVVAGFSDEEDEDAREEEEEAADEEDQSDDDDDEKAAADEEDEDDEDEGAALEPPVDPAAQLEAASAGWREFGLHEELVAKLASLGFVNPTPIQSACLPAALHSRRDVVGAAETGSGKTLAFGLPILQRLLEALSGSGTIQLLDLRGRALITLDNLDTINIFF